MTKKLIVNPVNPEIERIREAAAIIKRGGTVAFPTETVYGIGANAFDSNACSRIFEIKGRPIDNPLIVHISKFEQLNDVASDVPDEILKAAKILWPGPVTLILKKNKRVPDEVTAGLDTVAVRMPAHPVALRLIEESNTPIAAPSANTSTRPSATRVEHIIEDLDGKVDMIIDGGDTAFGLESTIINVTARPYVLLRPGAFTVEELQKYLGSIEVPESINMQMNEKDTAIAPGMKYRHYAPKKKLLAVNGSRLLVDATDIALKDRKVVVLCSKELSKSIDSRARVIPLGSESDLYGITKNLFNTFRYIDKLDVELALIQTFPERGIGLALMNRIIKASGREPVNTIEEFKECL